MFYSVKVAKINKKNVQFLVILFTATLTFLRLSFSLFQFFTFYISIFDFTKEKILILYIIYNI